MATHSNILDWRIPWTEEPGMLQSLGLQRVRHFKEAFSKYFESALYRQICKDFRSSNCKSQGHFSSFRRSLKTFSRCN